MKTKFIFTYFYKKLNLVLLFSCYILPINGGKKLMF
jgi:hypothetical protein